MMGCIITGKPQKGTIILSSRRWATAVMIFMISGLWLAGNEGMEKKVETIKMVILQGLL